MKTILTKTTGPIRVPLPLGKILHLGPNKTGEIAARAVDHPPLAKLVAAGDLEVAGDGHHENPRQGPAGSLHPANRGGYPAMNSSRRGDR